MLTIVVGAIKHPDPKDQDGVDKGIVAGKQYDVKSKSARDFFDGIKAIYDACVERQDDCCIGHLILDGHSTACLGGGEGLDKLTAAEIATLKSMLCPDATITLLGCYAFNLIMYPEYKLHFALAMLLAENGGSYEGNKATTTGLYPNVVSSDPKETEPSKVTVPKGATEDEVKKKFKKLDPKGQ